MLYSKNLHLVLEWIRAMILLQLLDTKQVGCVGSIPSPGYLRLTRPAYSGGVGDFHKVHVVLERQLLHHEVLKATWSVPRCECLHSTELVDIFYQRLLYYSMFVQCAIIGRCPEPIIFKLQTETSSVRYGMVAMNLDRVLCTIFFVSHCPETSSQYRE